MLGLNLDLFLSSFFFCVWLHVIPKDTVERLTKVLLPQVITIIGILSPFNSSALILSSFLNLQNFDFYRKKKRYLVVFLDHHHHHHLHTNLRFSPQFQQHLGCVRSTWTSQTVSISSETAMNTIMNINLS